MNATDVIDISDTTESTVIIECIEFNHFKQWDMRRKPHFISICSQKGGVGKSTFTVLAASLLHYRLGQRVLVVDCDYPQWSIFEQRRRELELLDRTDYYKLMMLRQFKATGRKIWPVVECEAAAAQQRAAEFLSAAGEEYDYVLFDLPGTTATKGVLRLIASLERVFVPMKADKMIMESTITFGRMIAESLVCNERLPMQGVHLFWSMVDRRERTALYDQYEQVLRTFRLPVMQTHVPMRARFSKELRPEGGPVYRSTLYPADKAFAAECCLDALCREICTITEGSHDE